MQRVLILTEAPINEAALVASRRTSPDCGAVVTFSGVVRDREPEGRIRALDYTAFTAMAEHQFAGLFDELEHRWPVASVRVVHRLGTISVGESSLWVEVVTPHRAEALAACQWLIDELKRIVPIWKRSVL